MNAWLPSVMAVRNEALRQDRHVLLVPMFAGKPLVYEYFLDEQAGHLCLTNRVNPRFSKLPARWATNDVKSLRLYCKLLSLPDGVFRLHAVAVKVNAEKEFNQKRNQLLEMHLMYQAGFDTSLGLSRVFGPDMQASDVRDYFSSVQEILSDGYSSFWTYDELPYPEPQGIQAFILG